LQSALATSTSNIFNPAGEDESTLMSDIISHRGQSSQALYVGDDNFLFPELEGGIVICNVYERG
jgi:hypothetical protein